MTKQLIFCKDKKNNSNIQETLEKIDFAVPPFLAFSLSPLQQDIDDDGGTKQRGDGIQGDDATARREGAEEIAEKGKD